MIKKQTLIAQSIEEQQAQTEACFSRFGTIVALNESTGTVRVEFDGNPFERPLTARLGRNFSQQELKIAVENKLNCRLVFSHGEISLPLVTDIFFSIINESNECTFRAQKLVIEAEQELIISSGEAEVCLSDSQVTIKAKRVISHAEQIQNIQGGTIAIN